MSDARLRELRRAAAGGDPDAAFRFASQVTSCDCGEPLERKTVGGGVLFYCPECGLDLIVIGVVKSFLQGGRPESAREYLRYSSLYMTKVESGWVRGGGL